MRRLDMTMSVHGPKAEDIPVAHAEIRKWHERVMPVVSPQVGYEGVNGRSSVAVRGPSLTHLRRLSAGARWTGRSASTIICAGRVEAPPWTSWFGYGA
jgi:hypothetical protein